MRRRQRPAILNLLFEEAAERNEFYDKLKRLDALADEFIEGCIRAHEKEAHPPCAYSLAVRMKQIIGTYRYGPSPFQARSPNEVGDAGP